MTGLYYHPPSDECFEDMKQAATMIWNRYEDPYRTEKLNRIKDIKNVGDNFMYLFAMFDINNMRQCSFLLKDETRDALRERLRDGGTDEPMIEAMVPMSLGTARGVYGVYGK